MQSYPLSPQQARIWRLGQANAGRPLRTSCLLQLTGEVDLPGLRRALDRVVGRHEILRTVLHTVPGLTLPLQTVLPAGVAGAASVGWDEEDWSALDPGEQDRRAIAWAWWVAPDGPDFSPGLHAALRRLSPACHLL